MPTFLSIPLTKGQTTIVDAVDYEAIVQFGSWCFSQSGYAVHYDVEDGGRRKTLYLHRVIMQRVLRHPIPPGLQVDHINLNRLDNRRLNLRLATRSQNQAHKGLQINNTSTYKGVTWNGSRWEARIRYQGQRIHLGRFVDPMEAALVYDAASRLLYRDFAGCNFPSLPTPSHIEKRLQETLNKRGLDTRHLMLKSSRP